MAFVEHIDAIRQRIARAAERSNRPHSSIRLIGVTKYVGPKEAIALYNSGIRDFGENRYQVAEPKLDAFDQNGIEDATWHFIGHLQSNKVKDVVRRFSLIHSVDRFSLAEEIQKRTAEIGKLMNCCIQVNVSGETSKGGFAPGEVGDVIQAFKELHNLRAIGLMTMAPRVDQPEETRDIFHKLRELQEQLHSAGHIDLKELSMGMSQDFEIAIEEGATMVRLGQILYQET